MRSATFQECKRFNNLCYPHKFIDFKHILSIVSGTVLSLFLVHNLWPCLLMSLLYRNKLWVDLFSPFSTQARLPGRFSLPLFFFFCDRLKKMKLWKERSPFRHRTCILCYVFVNCLVCGLQRVALSPTICYDKKHSENFKILKNHNPKREYRL